MPGTYSCVIFHIIFATKDRSPFIDAEFRPRLYDYWGGIICNEGGVLYAIGGVEDHLHLLFRWRLDVPVSTLMRKGKSGSTLWVRETFPRLRRFKWQESYACFSVSKSVSDRVKHYIEHQEEHHRRMDFKEELRKLLARHDVEVDPRYFDG